MIIGIWAGGGEGWGRGQPLPHSQFRTAVKFLRQTVYDSDNSIWEKTFQNNACWREKVHHYSAELILGDV